MKLDDIKINKLYQIGRDGWLTKGTTVKILSVHFLYINNLHKPSIRCITPHNNLIWYLELEDFEKELFESPLLSWQPNLLIIGYSRAGKDTAAEYFRDTFGMTFMSSSMAAAEIFIFDLLIKKYGYASKEDCYADRMNRRAEWFDLISEYNKEDKTKLGRAILSKTGAYIGMRSKEEVQACREQNVFDLIIWIDAEERVSKEGIDSCTVSKEDADIIITNNGTVAELEAKLLRIGKIIFK